MVDKFQIINELKYFLASKLGDNLKQVILFGTQAYGEAKEFSDYGILIILKGKSNWKPRRKISDYCYEIDLKYEIFTDVHILGEEEPETLRGKLPIIQTTIQQGIYA